MGSAVIFSGNDVKTLKSNIDINGINKIMSGAVDPTVSATSAPIGSLYLNNSTGKTYRKLDAGLTVNWTELGSGSSGKNYILTSDGSSTTGWATYADAAGTRPVDGVGGSPAVTWTSTTSSPLDGISSFLFTKTAVNSQGQGVAYAFAIDSSDQGQVLGISFDYSPASGTFVGSGVNTVNSDLIVYLYDVTNSVLIEPSTLVIDGAVISSKLKFRSSFQTSSNSTSYRLILHVATTSASAYTVKIDDVVVGPQALGLPGLVVAAAYQMSGQQAIPNNSTEILNFQTSIYDKDSSVTTGASWKFTAKEDGIYHVDSMVNLQPSGNWTVPTTWGLTLFKNGGLYLAGANATAWNTNGIELTAPFSGDVSLKAGDYIDLRGYHVAGGSRSTSSASNSWITVHKVSGSGVSSTSNAGKVVTGSYGGSVQAVTSNTTLLYTAKTVDTDSLYDTATGKITAQESGYYDVSASVYLNTTADFDAGEYVSLEILKGAVVVAAMDRRPYTGEDYPNIAVRETVYLLAGEFILIRCTQTSGVSLNTFAGVNARLNFTKVPGSGVSSASNAVVGVNAARSASQTLNTGTDTVVVWNTRLADTTSSLNTSTGVFTCPVSGWYDVKALVRVDSVAWTVGNVLEIHIRKTGVDVQYTQHRIEGSFTNSQDIFGSHTFPCVSGDTIDIIVAQNTGNNTTIGAPGGNVLNTLSITRLCG